MTDLQRARLDLLVTVSSSIANNRMHEGQVMQVFAPAFEYLEKLEAEATQPNTPKLRDENTGTEFTASLAPHFKAELSRICVETGKPLSEWAIGTAIDQDGDIYEWSSTPEYARELGVWTHRIANAEKIGVVDLAGRDPAMTWREYPKVAE